jgi:chromosome segregation ATPase
MAKAETWTWRDLITPATVLTIGAIAVTVFVGELRGIETRLTEMDSKIANVDAKIANVDAKIDRRGDAVEQHLTETDNRLAQTIKRLDLGLDQQADMSSKINKIDADLTFIHKRIDMLDQPKARGSNPPH